MVVSVLWFGLALLNLAVNNQTINFEECLRILKDTSTDCQGNVIKPNLNKKHIIKAANVTKRMWPFMLKRVCGRTYQLFRQ